MPHEKEFEDSINYAMRKSYERQHTIKALWWRWTRWNKNYPIDGWSW